MRASYFSNNDGARVRLQGIFAVTAPAGQNTTFTYNMTTDRFMTGMNYILYNRNKGDYIDFEVHHPTAGLIDPFAQGYYVKDEEEFCCYGARIYTGLQIKLKYYNVGANAVDIYMNGVMHTFPETIS